MDASALFKISYGLFIATARDAGFDNGCVGNVCVQVASSPTRVALALNKLNKTCWMVKNSGAFNISILSTSAPFDVFKRFGFQSGADVDKFADIPKKRAENGIVYLDQFTNALLSCKVVDAIDLGSHFLFVAEVEDAKKLSDEESMTYDYYHKNVKPRPNAKSEVKGWRCKICGYVYEGDELPTDFICPTCKHGAEDFERIE